MNREAAVLGTPVWSMFEGRLGAVDELLVHQGRLRLLRDPDDIVVTRKGATAVPTLRDPGELLALALPWNPMTSFDAFDRRGYRTVDARTGYGAWAPTYEDTVQDAMDVELLDALTELDVAGATVADLGCGSGRTGAWLHAHGADGDRRRRRHARDARDGPRPGRLPHARRGGRGAAPACRSRATTS